MRGGCSSLLSFGERALWEMTDQLDRIEWKLDQILAYCLRGTVAEGTIPDDAAATIAEARKSVGPVVGSVLSRFTVKQHAVLQMLLRGAGNAEIAERFGVSPNTAKVYVRTIAKKVGVNTRAQIVMRTLEDFNSVDDNSYRLMTGGLPKDWDADWSEPDAFEHLLRKRNDVETGIEE